ncbi:MAG: MATE family efflux transporter [Blautia sp.]|nr:MATE family efflux transporter [Blautia sp.]
MKKVDFDDGNITQDILKTAFPMLVAQVLNLLYSIVDRVYIGRIPDAGTTALGAVGLCFPIIIMVAAFTNMFGMGGAPLFAIELGRGDRKKAGQIQNTAFRLLVVTGVILTAVGEICGGPLLRLFGAGEAELPVSLSYLRIYMIGTLPLMLSTGMNPYITAQGYAMIGMISVTIGAVANLLLDPLFIFILGMGVEGAALATVISQMLSVGFVFLFLFGKKNEYPITRGTALPYAGEIAGLGIAPFTMQVTNSLVQIACNQVLMQLGGVVFVSVMTIISSVRSILDVPVMAITEGTSPVLSYNYGARRPANVRKAFRVMLMMALPYTLLVWLAVLLRADVFIRIFSSDTEILADASRALHIYFGAFIFQSLQYSGQTVFKALGKKKHAIFFSLLRKAVLVVPLTYLLPLVFHLGTDGVFLAEPISNVVGGLACFITMLATVTPELAGME